MDIGAYTLIYNFLSTRDHAKAAKSVKKAAKQAGIVSIKAGTEPSTETSLENIIHEWRTLSTRNVELETLNRQLLVDMKSLKKNKKRKGTSSSSE